MRLWRVSRYAGFDGEGARRLGGRWHDAGTVVIYTAASLALATLEFLVHVERRDPAGAAFAHYADVPGAISADAIDDAVLPLNWRATPAPRALREIGGDWARAGSGLMLSVPSALLGVSPALAPTERNYLLNPGHPDFARVRVNSVTLDLDPRMWG